MQPKVYFNGRCLSDLFTVSNVNRPLPSITTNVQEMGGDGSRVVGTTLEPIQISMTLWVTDSDLYEQRQAIRQAANILYVNETKPLKFDDDNGRYYMAMPSGGVNTEGFIDGGKIEVTFYVPQPAMYGRQNSVTIPSGGSATLNVGGSYKTYPVITAASAVPSSGVWGVRLDDGDYLYFNFTGTKSVSIDCAERACTVGGVSALPTLQSDWFELSPGKHTIKNDKGSGSCIISWQERWL